MKTILLSFAAFFTLVTVSAQYSENFGGTQNGLTGNCWTLNNVLVTTTDVITGNSSVYSQPPTNGSSTRDIVTPALNVTSTSFTVSFKYKLSSSLNGNATRTVEVGLLNPSGIFTSLAFITLNSSTAITVFNFNQTFTLSSTGWRKLVIKAGGSTGSGSVRLIFDDLYTNASPLYGTGTCNNAPIAANDAFNGITGQPVSGNVMSNDNEPNGESMTSSVVTTSADGSLVMNTDGSFVFTPNAGFTGSATTFTYQLTDNGFDPVISNVGQVTINYSTPVALPVTLVSFSASLNAANEVDLQWTTSSEKNVNHFSVEKSLDGRTYEEIGHVFAKGNSSELINYNFSDNNINTAKAGTIYYRLRSVDTDGTFELSIVKRVTIGNQNKQAITVSTYPNPVSNQMNVSNPFTWQSKKVVYEIIGTNGQVVKKSIASNASQTETVDVSNLAPGFYILTAICDGEKAQQKLIKR